MSQKLDPGGLVVDLHLAQFEVDRIAEMLTASAGAAGDEAREEKATFCKRAWKRECFSSARRVWSSIDADQQRICGLKALSLNSQNPATYRLLAELAERGKSPQAIYLRHKV